MVKIEVRHNNVLDVMCAKPQFLYLPDSCFVIIQAGPDEDVHEPQALRVFHIIQAYSGIYQYQSAACFDENTVGYHPAWLPSVKQAANPGHVRAAVEVV
jgi:hypothetical protein